MKKLIIFLIMLPFMASAQLEKVFVETYYISDSLDATDTDGGFLEQGSKTYRVYIDLLPGSLLKSVYGDANHALKFFSTDTFFNNVADGQTYGNKFSKNRYGDNTVALDTWITLGQTTTTATKTYFGTPKTLDDDGSFIGGVNNDGGSAGIPTGLLTNADPLAGIPLTTADGMDTSAIRPANFAGYGIVDFTTNDDSTIFGSIVPGNQFISYNAGLTNSGVWGTNADSNYVLVAQLTTMGDIEFELNIEVIDTAGTVIKYVANDSILLAGEVLNRYLKYPYLAVCGCPDPNYLEYLANRSCDATDSCQTLIVFGCTDTTACNYDANANFNVPSLCCYPGRCNDRNLAVVCPQLINERTKELTFTLYPNPADDILNIQFTADAKTSINYLITDAFGRQVSSAVNMRNEGLIKINTSAIAKGVYLLKISNGDDVVSKRFVKN
jgi:Secretion system C-terminal sorting domain